MVIKRNYEQKYNGKFYYYLIEVSEFKLKQLIKNKESGIFKIATNFEVFTDEKEKWIPYYIYIAIDERPRSGELTTYMCPHPDGNSYRSVSIKKEGFQYCEFSDEQLIIASSNSSDIVLNIHYNFLVNYINSKGNLDIIKVEIDKNNELIIKSKPNKKLYKKLQIVSYELAQLLRGLDFDYQCDHYYDVNSNYEKGYKLSGAIFKVENKHKAVSAPTQELAKKFIRDKYDLHITIPLNKKWFYEIYDIFDNYGPILECTDEFESYEDALEEALILCCKNINNKSWIDE